jgi:hypothetical protein
MCNAIQKRVALLGWRNGHLFLVIYHAMTNSGSATGKNKYLTIKSTQMKHMKQMIFAAFIAIAMTGCGPSTEIVKSWHEPGSTVTKADANKTLVIAMVKDESSRRIIEDELAKRLGPNAVVSYKVVTTDMLKEGNEASLNLKLTEGQYTHLLIMSLADIEKETNYVPGTTTGYYGGYGRYYGYGAGMYSSPGYYTEDKNYYIETTVFSIKENKLLWTGVTKTVNPSKVQKTVNDIADVVSDKMKKDGFVK